MHYVYGYFDMTKSGSDFGFEFEPFYIGKGKGKRAEVHLKEVEQNKKSGNLLKFNKIKKLIGEQNNLQIKIIIDELSDDQAKTIEMGLIADIGTITDIPDLKRGPLTNMTRGGDGMSGYKFTEEQRLGLKTAIANSPNRAAGAIKAGLSNLGKRHSLEHRQKISKAHRGKVFTQEHIKNNVESRIRNGNSKRTEDTKKKISQALAGKKQTADTITKRMSTIKAGGFDFKTRKKSWVIFDVNDDSYIFVDDLTSYCKLRGLDPALIGYTSKSKKEHKKEPGFILMPYPRSERKNFFS